jgi:hypothetical protein
MDLPDLRGLRDEDDGLCFLKVLVELLDSLLVTCIYRNAMELVQSSGAFSTCYSIARRHVESPWRGHHFVHGLKECG